MSNVNLVTGYWNGRSDRTEQKYLRNFKNVLLLNHNMTIFIPKEFEKFVLEHRNDKLDKTRIIITELENIKAEYFDTFWDKVQRIRTNPSWYNSTDWLKNVPQYFSEWYNPIVMSKVEFLYEAHQINEFDSDNYIWIDAGITQHISTDIVCDESVQKMSDYIETVLFPSVPYTGHEVHGFNYEGFKKYTDIIPTWLCRATIFGCSSEYVEMFKTDYDSYLNDTLERGYMGTEESIFGLLTCTNPSIYKRYHTIGSGMPDVFLHDMKNKKQ
jgi:hypothetical protein